jgi:hypothetical protein
MKGDTIQLRPNQLERGENEVHLTPQQSRRIKTALKHGRGVRLQFDSTQRNAHSIQGGNIKQIGRVLKRHGKQVGRQLLKHGKQYAKQVARQYVHDMIDEYAPEDMREMGHSIATQQMGGNLKKVGRQIRSGLKTAYKASKPYLRQGLHAGVDTIATMTGNEHLAPAGHLAVDIIGNETKAYGIKSRKRRTGGALFAS